MKQILLALSVATCTTKATPTTATQKPAQTFLKGQTHVHSNNSGDSETPPGEVAQWYAAHGYDFIVFTDHNFVTPALSDASLLTIPGVELTQNSRDCLPAPEPGLGCLLHLNALFIESNNINPVPWGETKSKERVDIYQRALDASNNLQAIAQLNHPNFHYGADAKLLTEMSKRGVLLIEFFNQSTDINNEGDSNHPNTELLWDQVLTMGGKVFAVASDDAHHYNDIEALKARGEPYYEGDLGFIMVRAEKDPRAIKAAVSRGDFYSSNGVLLSRYEATQEAIEVVVDAKPAQKYVIHFIGEGGKTLTTQEGNSARLSLSKIKSKYVRVRVDDNSGKHAWLQPVWLP